MSYFWKELRGLILTFVTCGMYDAVQSRKAREGR